MPRALAAPGSGSVVSSAVERSSPVGLSVSRALAVCALLGCVRAHWLLAASMCARALLGFFGARQAAPADENSLNE